MSKKKYLVTIVIATFNSEKTLPLVLEAIRSQTFSQSLLELLIIDGGSTDKTVQIAKKFKCKVIPNPQTEPVYAKFLGYKKAEGKYIMYLDHDEVIENKKSLQTKISVFEKNKNVHAVIGGGYKNPKGYPFINNYINEFGDPFSFFIYRLSKDANFFIKDMRKKYSSDEDNISITFDFKKTSVLPLIELCAAGSIIDATYLKKYFPRTLKDKKYIPHFFYLLVEKSLISITKNDALIHYSSDTYQKYLNKIRWRIKNNIYHVKEMGQAGFTGREKYQPAYIRIRKYLFIPYAFTLLFLLIDTLYLIITRKNVFYIVHIPLTLFTALLIMYHYVKKILGRNESLRSYDEKVLIKK